LAGLCYIALKRYEEAIETLNYLMKISNRHQHALTALISAYCDSKNVAVAGTLMEELKRRSATEYIGCTYFALSAAYLGDVNTALDYLEKGYDDRDPIIVQIKNSPFVPPSLRSDPRFQNLLERIGFPE
jgi:tetratricopeptide (TPR) repeat protein